MAEVVGSSSAPALQFETSISNGSRTLDTPIAISAVLLKDRKAPQAVQRALNSNTNTGSAAAVRGSSPDSPSSPAVLEAEGPRNSSHDTALRSASPEIPALDNRSGIPRNPPVAGNVTDNEANTPAGETAWSDFPTAPDKSDNADIWKTYVRETNAYDEEMIKGWNEGIDVFLVFTGLFSAILSAFLIYSWTLLQPDNVQATVDALAAVSLQLGQWSPGQLQNKSLVYQAKPFVAPLYAIAVNALWFTGLFFSLFAAVTGMLVKEWLTVYKKDRESIPLKRVEQRQLLYEGMLGWHVPSIITFLPLAIHLALFLFFTGLVILAWPVSAALSIWMAVLLVIGFCLYFASALVPLRHYDCPYKSPLYSVLSRLFLWFHEIGRLPLFLYYLAGKLYGRLRHVVGRDIETAYRAEDRAEETFDEFETKYRALHFSSAEFDKCQARYYKVEAELDQKRAKLQFEAVTWLFRSPNQFVQEEALYFLSWWRPPRSWCGSLSTEAPEAAERLIRYHRLLKPTDHPASEDYRKLAFLLPFIGLRATFEAHAYGWKPIPANSKPRSRKLSPESLATAANLDTMSSHSVPPPIYPILQYDAPNEVALCIELDGALPIVRGTPGFPWRRTIIVLEEMIYTIQAYPEYRRLFVKYVDALEQALLISSELREVDVGNGLDQLLRSRGAGSKTIANRKGPSGHQRRSISWESRYPDPVSAEPVSDKAKRKIQTEWLNRLMLIIFALLPNVPRLSWWVYSDAYASRIQRGLIELVLHHPDMILVPDPPILYLSSVQRYITRFAVEEASSDGDRALHQLVEALLQKCSSRDHWDDNFSSFHWVLQYIGVSENHWGWLQEIFDRWIDGVEDAGRQSVPNTSFMEWLVKQIQTPSTPLCAAAIVVPFAALSAYLPPRGDTKRIAVMDCLISAQWPECMLEYGFDYVASYNSTRRIERKDRLLLALKGCIEQMHEKRPVPIEGSGLWKKYNEFGGWPQADTLR